MTRTYLMPNPDDPTEVLRVKMASWKLTTTQPLVGPSSK